MNSFSSVIAPTSYFSLASHPTIAKSQEIPKQSALFDQKLDEIFSKILRSFENPFFQIITKKPILQFLTDLQKGCAELKSRAVKELEKGKSSFIVKIQPRKEPTLYDKGIQFTAIFIVRQGALDPSNIIVKGSGISNKGSQRQMRPAFQLNGDVLMQQKLMTRPTKKFDRATQVELEILEKLGKHPNIVELVLNLDNQKIDRRPAIYYECLPFALTANGPDNSPETIKKILGQLKDVAEGLKQCHSLDIYHGDIKPVNIRLNAIGVAKLIDFGNSIRLPHDDDLYLTCTYFYCSPYLLKKYNERRLQTTDAPKMSIEELRRYYQSGDLWSFACVAFELLNPSEQKGDGRLPSAILKKIEEVDFLLQMGRTDDFNIRRVMSETNFLDPQHPEYLQELNLFAERHGVFGELIKRIFITKFEEIEQLPTLGEISQALSEYRSNPKM